MIARRLGAKCLLSIHTIVHLVQVLLAPGSRLGAGTAPSGAPTTLVTRIRLQILQTELCGALCCSTQSYDRRVYRGVSACGQLQSPRASDCVFDLRHKVLVLSNQLIVRVCHGFHRRLRAGDREEYVNVSPFLQDRRTGSNMSTSGGDVVD
jgi:hypothetical protein